jgi:hypothetical protein
VSGEVQWIRRLAVLFVIWAALLAVSISADTDPQPIVLASAIVGVAAVVFLALEVVDGSQAASWDTWSPAVRTLRGGDPRVGMLRRVLQVVTTTRDVAQIHPLLVGIVDERLAARHAIVRADEPERAAAIMGPELTQFVEMPPGTVRLGSPALLGDMLTRIEAL